MNIQTSSSFGLHDYAALDHSAIRKIDANQIIELAIASKHLFSGNAPVITRQSDVKTACTNPQTVAKHARSPKIRQHTL